jgi:hypothetical protein
MARAAKVATRKKVDDSHDLEFPKIGIVVAMLVYFSYAILIMVRYLNGSIVMLFAILS